MLLAGYSTKAYQGMGDAYLLPAIAAVVLGGTHILGGRGRYARHGRRRDPDHAAASVLSVMQMPEAGRQIIYGVVIIAMLLRLRPIGESGGLEHRTEKLDSTFRIDPMLPLSCRRVGRHGIPTLRLRRHRLLAHVHPGGVGERCNALRGDAQGGSGSIPGGRAPPRRRP